MVGFVTLVPALCRSFTRSPRVVLGFLLTVLVIILTPRGEIFRGAPDRGRLSVVLYVFHFLIFAPTVDIFKRSCLPIADSVFPTWCRSTILFLVSFDSSLVLAIVEFGVDAICGSLGMLKAICKKLVNKYKEKLIDALANDEDAKAACKELKLCKRDTIYP
uniref:Saposin B-type domain-containing protein n=1 Tax=Hucho hucho TaxID=62062 RepID=A0A4W5KZB0_9TELE